MTHASRFHRSVKDQTRKLTDVLVYLGLVACVIFFVRTSIIEFLEGGRGYATTQESLSLNDFPTLVICLRYPQYQYSIDKSISVFANVKEETGQGQTVRLREFISVPTLTGLELHLSELWPRKKRENQ